MNRRHALAALCAPLLPGAALGSAAETGIVLLHGKQLSSAHMSDVAAALRGEGFVVATPTMPWSQARELDVPYARALDEIGASADTLMRGGTKQIVVGGHSFGANAAFAYAASAASAASSASRRPAAAIFALAPGHVPERGGFRKLVAPGVDKAREMIAKGEGEKSASFPDTNQGRAREIRTSANAYLSYCDPEGLASMPRSAAAIPAALPIFMAVGDSDSIAGYARTAIFDAAPKHAQSEYVDGPGDHISTMRIATPRLVAWLKSLAA